MVRRNAAENYRRNKENPKFIAYIYAQPWNLQTYNEVQNTAGST